MYTRFLKVILFTLLISVSTSLSSTPPRPLSSILDESSTPSRSNSQTSSKSPISTSTADPCSGVSFIQLTPTAITYTNHTIVLQQELRFSKLFPLSTPLKFGLELVSSNRFPIYFPDPKTPQPSPSQSPYHPTLSEATYTQSIPVKFHLDLPLDLKFDSEIQTYTPSTHFLPLDITTTATYSSKTNLTTVESVGKSALLDLHRGVYANYIDHEAADYGEPGYIEPTPLDPRRRLLFISLQVNDTLPDFPPQNPLLDAFSDDLSGFTHEPAQEAAQTLNAGANPVDIPKYTFRVWFAMNVDSAWCTHKLDLSATPLLPLESPGVKAGLEFGDTASQNQPDSENKVTPQNSLQASQIRLIRHSDKSLPVHPDQYSSYSNILQGNDPKTMLTHQAIQDTHSIQRFGESQEDRSIRGHLNYTLINPNNEPITHITIQQLGYTYTKQSDHITTYNPETKISTTFPPSAFDTQFYRTFYPYGKQQAILTNGTLIWYSPSTIFAPINFLTRSFQTSWTQSPAVYKHNVTKDIVPFQWVGLFQYYFTTRDVIESSLARIAPEHVAFIKTKGYEPLVTEQDYLVQQITPLHLKSDISQANVDTNSSPIDDLNATTSSSPELIPGYTISVWDKDVLLYAEVVDIPKSTPSRSRMTELLRVIAILSLVVAILLSVLIVICIVLCCKRRQVQAERERTAIRKTMIKQTQYGEFADQSSFSSNW